MQPLDELVVEARRVHEEAMKAFDITKIKKQYTSEANREAMRNLSRKIGRAKAEGNDTDSLEAELEEMAERLAIQGEESPEPAERRYITNDTTVEKLTAGHLVTISKPASAAAEAYRTLRTNLLYDALMDTPSKVIVLTSPGLREDKSTVCANLGVVLVQANKRTLIVDCDLRDPVLHRTFGLRNSWGIADALTKEQSLGEDWHEPLPGLKVIIGGSSTLDPTKLLGSERFARFLGQVRRDFDHVLIDAPPIEPVSDTAILAAQSDGVLLVLDYKRTLKKDVQQAMRSLETVRANVLGTVLTNVKLPKGAYRR